MKKHLGIGLLLATFVVFLILNRGAYQSWFSDDDLDTLSWAPYVRLGAWVKGFLVPLFDAANFRVTGHLFFGVLGKTAKLHFPYYVAVLQAIHLFNAVLLWRLARRLGLTSWASTSAAAFFTLNMAAFDAFWKPMYCFDVLCATFCLISLLLYISKRWVLCFLSLWVAYKAKELAVMLPAVFLLYEYLLGERKGRRLIVFLVFSLSFGLQGLILNPNKNNAYTFHLTVQALSQTVPFYASRLLLLPYAGFAFLLLCFVARDRRVWFGVGTMCILFVPLVFLPGRIFPAYVYLPQIGGTIALATAFSLISPVWAVLFFAAWIPWNVRELRIDRRATIAAADEARVYSLAMIEFAKTHPNPPPMVFANTPIHFAQWGITGIANIAWSRNGLQPQWVDSPRGQRMLKSPRVFLIVWEPPAQKLYFVERDASKPDLSFLRMNTRTPPWQLTSGFHELDDYFRWIDPEATAQLWRPAAASAFEVQVNIHPEMLPSERRITLAIDLDEHPLGSQTFSNAGLGHARFEVPAIALPRESHVRFHVVPAYTPPGSKDILGVGLVSFGFTPAPSP